MKKLLIFVLTIFISSTAFAGRHNALRTFGDYMQVINPVAAGLIASQERGAGHFAIIFAEDRIANYAIKYGSKAAKLEMSKRPNNQGKKARYEGMPSAHTGSAWIAASYLRTFSENPYISIPFYITAGITGYSRVKSKEHTVAQVVAGAAIAELVTYINYRLEWSEKYEGIPFKFGATGDGAGITIKF